MALSHDDLWPRAGGWPVPAGRSDAVVLGVPAWRTSLSPTGTHATPAAMREALRRYSPAVLRPEPIDLNEALRVADAGDVDEPDGPEGEARVRARVAEAAAASDLVIALGGDNSITFPVAGGAGAEALITLDAHFDLRDGVSNGSPVRRLVEEGGLDPRHPARIAVDGYLGRLADNLQNDPATRAKLENAKASLFDSPRVGALAAEAWNTAKNGLLAALADPESGLRRRYTKLTSKVFEPGRVAPGAQPGNDKAVRMLPNDVESLSADGACGA